MHLSSEFFELIKAIGESKSKQEEDRIIAKEVATLKRKLESGSAGGGGGGGGAGGGGIGIGSGSGWAKQCATLSTSSREKMCFIIPMIRLC